MLWGVAAALLANLLFSAGFVIEKRALSALPALSASRPWHLVLRLLRSPLWLLGAVSLLLGFAAQLAVYRTLPLVAAQGLFVTGLVLLLLLSSLVLGERPSGRERQGMAAIVAALVMIVCSLRGSTEQISGFAPVPLVLGLCLPSLALAFGLFAAADRRSRRRHRRPTAGVPYGVAIGVLYGVSSLAIKGTAGHIDTADIQGTVAATLGSPYPYILLCTGAGGLVLSQTALQRCRASLIVPVCTTVNFLFAVVSGTFLFAEPLPDDLLRLALRLGGAALAVTVLLGLPRHDATETPEPSGAVPQLPSAGRPLSATCRPPDGGDSPPDPAPPPHRDRTIRTPPQRVPQHPAPVPSAREAPARARETPERPTAPTAKGNRHESDVR